MRDLGRRLLIGLAVVAAAVMAIGYAFIAGGIATPVASDLGTFDVPPEPGALPVLLADGRPAFIVADEDGTTVLDARGRHDAGAPGRLVTWCGDGTGIFLDLVDGTGYGPDGQLLGGPAENGLVAYPIRPIDDGARIVVGAEGESAGLAPGEPVTPDCPSRDWVGHGPVPAEVFDPSVAADEEPPGWIWLEGHLTARDGSVLLCNGVGAGCDTGGPVTGIDPATVPSGDAALAGSFIGRVRDGAIVDLNFVPDPGGAP